MLQRAIFRLLSGIPRNLRGRAQQRVLLVSHQRRFVFVKVPLVASQSLEAALWQASEQSGFDLQRVVEPSAQARDSTREYFWFAFVRNPWARIVSCYHKKLVNADTFDKLRLISRFPGLSPGMGFRSFIDFLCGSEGADNIADMHWMSQLRILHDAAGQRLCHEVRQLEDLEDCLDVFERATGVRLVSFPKIGGSVTMGSLPAFSDFRKYYDADTWGKVRSRYNIDCVTFGYDVEPAVGVSR